MGETPDILPDGRSTKRGSKLLRKSLKDLGAGRSILLVKNNRVIAASRNCRRLDVPHARLAVLCPGKMRQWRSTTDSRL
jgi:hypothetical protein